MSRMRAILALLVVIGFQAILAAMLLGQADPVDNPTMQTLLGSLSTAFGVVLQWHFGSSSGSERKTDLLAQSSPKSKPPSATVGRRGRPAV